MSDIPSGNYPPENLIDILIVCLKSKKLTALDSDGKIKKKKKKEMNSNMSLRLSFHHRMQNPCVVYK